MKAIKGNKISLSTLIKKLNAGYVLLWFMVTVYPLIVIPHPFYIGYPGGTVLPAYFYAPRYLILVIVSIVSLFLLIKENPQIKHPAFIPLGMFLIFGLISALLAPIPVTAWIGSPFRFTGLSTYLCCAVLFILAMYRDFANTNFTVHDQKGPMFKWPL